MNVCECSRLYKVVRKGAEIWKEKVEKGEMRRNG